MIGVGLATWAGLLAYGRLELHAETRSLKWPVLIYLGVCAWVFVQWTPWIPQGFAKRECSPEPSASGAHHRQSGRDDRRAHKLASVRRRFLARIPDDAFVV